jgi:hypothetical protein
VRTIVEEDIQLFGCSIKARGVPFMEQNGHMLRCAHVVAWQCHYTAVLRGFVPRRPSAAFFQAGSLYRDGNRRYPSRGLTANAIVELLGRFDLPPDVSDLQRLKVTQPMQSYHRPELAERDVTGWWRHNVTAEVCRYLNSGMPLALTIPDHAVTICGYLRARHMKDDAIVSIYSDPDRVEYSTWGATANTSAADDVVAFIIHDDQRGPYCLVTVDHLLELMTISTGNQLSRGLSGSLITPRPHSVWLTGSEAEDLGWKFFETKLQQIREEPRFLSALASSSGAEVRSLVLEELQALDELLRARELAVRSYVATTDDFKLSFARRCGDDDATRAVRLARMPRFIWVVEALERGHRRDKPVVAQVVLDASGTSDRRAAALIVQLRGVLLIAEPSWGRKSLLCLCAVREMDSGRWADNDLQTAPIMSRAKGAIPVESMGGLY